MKLGIQSRANPKLIAVGVDDGHISEPLEALVRWLFHRDTSALQIRVPLIHARNVEMNQPTHLAISRMLRQVEAQTISGDT